MNLQDLVTELERQKEQKWDKKASSKDIRMAENRPYLTLGEEKSYELTPSCHSQLADNLGIPVKYYQRMLADDSKLLADNVNVWLNRQEENPLFIRGMGEKVRAVLSQNYRVIDHYNVLMCSLTELQSHQIEIEDCHLSETSMHVKIKSNQMKDFIRHRGDEIIGGVLIANSETGHGAVNIKPRIFRVQCTNGLVLEKFVSRQVHLGNGKEYTDTELLDDQVYLSIRQSIRETFNQFGKIVIMLREATEVTVNDPSRIINNVVREYRMTEEQKDQILISFGMEKDKTKYGIVNAITNAALSQDNFEKAIEMEKIGGRIIEMDNGRFKQLEYAG